jgi:catechol 2,3-dioxygenase-like lactoylglutathione lyase family enzyme
MPLGREDDARKFYGEILGLPEVGKPEHLRSRGGVWFETDEVRVHLGIENDFQPALKAYPAFLVSNMKELVVRFTEFGYMIVEDQPLEGFNRIYVSDPFGNRIEIMEKSIYKDR